MTADTMAKPGKGKPQTPAQRAAVLAMEQEVIERHAVRGQSFYRIDQELGITNSNRIYKRAMEERPMVQRAEAAEIQRARLDALHERAWDALERDGLTSLFERLRDVMNQWDRSEQEIDRLADAIERTIERAYADTYKAVPVALQVHDRFVKLDGLDHAARVADAGLAIEQAKLQLMAGCLVKALGVVESLTTEDKREIVAALGRELEAAQGVEA